MEPGFYCLQFFSSSLYLGRMTHVRIAVFILILIDAAQQGLDSTQKVLIVRTTHVP